MNQYEQLEAKMNTEFDTYRNWLLTQSPEEILNHANEYNAKQEIMAALSDADLSPAQIETLLRSPCPLEDVFKDYQQMDFFSDPVWDFREFITLRADDVMKRQRAAPIYLGTLTEARERGEVDKFKASAEADENCKTAIENAIARNYDGSRLNTKAAIAEVRERFGEKRMARVTASLIANREHDGRIRPENKTWAEKNATTKKVYTDRTHSGLLDIFATRLREDLAKKRERGAER